MLTFAVIGHVEVLAVTSLLSAGSVIMTLRAIGSDLDDARRRRKLTGEVDRLHKAQQQRLRQMALVSSCAT